MMFIFQQDTHTIMGYTSNTGLPEKSIKYHCMVSGAKRLTPCNGCSNPAGCIAKTMQYKESKNNMAETPTVQLLADGGIKCAKGLDLSECGYKPGAKVCGKCGAVAVAVKGEEFETEWVESTEKTGDMKPKKIKPVSEMEVMASEAVDAESSEDDEEKMYDGMGAMPKKKKKKAGMHMMPDGTMMADEDMPKAMYDEDDDDDDDEEEYDEVDEDEEKMWGELEEMLKNRKKARKKRMESMGVKTAEFDGDEKAFVCAIERKMYPGGADICANCPGGCEPHGEMPTLLEVEGIAESMFAGKVLDSGYADQTDIFVVDIERKDGKAVEAYFDGTNGECMGWHLLNQDLIGEVAAVPGEKVISFDEAASIATKSIEGEVVAVDADMFEGYDAYAVEIEGVDGKSYDVFVGIDGEVLGYDEYDAEEAADIDAEVADLALKRMYSEDQRAEMAKGGMALPDGSYPIKDEADLQNAIQAFGRAKDKAAAKAHIMKRAKELGKEDMIPENWASMENTISEDEAKSLLGSLMEFEMLALEIEENNGDFK